MSSLKIKVTLTVVEGTDHEKSVQMLKPSIIIGRRNTDFNLQDHRISTQHVKVEIRDAQVFVEDLNSRNGTFVDGQKIENPTEVKNLHEIEIGFTKIRVNIVENLAFFKNKQKEVIDEKTVRNSDIGGLIKDELERFSKWDLSNPSIEDLSKPKESKYPFGFQVKKGPDRGKIFYFDQDRIVVGPHRQVDPELQGTLLLCQLRRFLPRWPIHPHRKLRQYRQVVGPQGQRHPGLQGTR